MLGELRASWAPRSFIVSFKLETDEALLDSKASASLRQYGQNAVVCNLLASYRDRVVVKFRDGGQKTVLNQPGRHIEQLFLPLITEAHDVYAKSC